ncbi:copper resistance D family protein [Kangiella shandongensis]|uniref:copper resistance D family protein n=1 Tax=Kangiella shandongensis TaxID=2763258 RepID=UPI001CBE87DB|nr:CopD family protein [Kangiella shandongensis]
MLIIGLTSTVIYFFVQVGSFTQTGLAGMFNPDIMQMLLTTGNGDVLVYRTVGLSVVILSLALPYNRFEKLKLPGSLLLLLGAILCIFSFTAIGHVAELAWYWKVALFVHVWVAFAWIGSLRPLAKAVALSDKKDTATLLESYSTFGLILVSLLVIAGAGLVYILMIAPEQTISTEYLTTIIVKLTLVSMMLGFAAYHKVILGHKLKRGLASQQEAARSIIIEKAIGYIVLAVTAILTTTIGINH